METYESVMTNNNAIFEALQAYYDYVDSRSDIYVPWKYKPTNTDPRTTAAKALSIQLENEDYYAEELLAFGTNYAIAKYYEDTTLIELADTIVNSANRKEISSVSDVGLKDQSHWLFAMTRSLSAMGNDAIQKGIAVCRLEHPEALTGAGAFHSDRLHGFHTLLARNVAAERYIQAPTQNNRNALEQILDISKYLRVQNTWELQRRRTNAEWITLTNALVLQGIPKDKLEIPKIHELHNYLDSTLKTATNLYPLEDAPLHYARGVLHTYVRIHGHEKALLASLLTCLKHYPQEETLYHAMAIHEAYPQYTNLEGSPLQSVLRYIFATCDQPWNNMDAAMRNVFCSNSPTNPWSQEYLDFKKTYGNKPIINPVVKTALALGSIQELIHMLDAVQVQPLAMPAIQEQP
jgi:hypothetical protein